MTFLSWSRSSLPGTIGPDSLAAQIRAARALLGWSQPALAKASGVSLPTIVRMEDLGLLHLVEDLPRVRDWFARAQQRPSFARAYYPGSRMKAAKPEALEGIAAC